MESLDCRNATPHFVLIPLMAQGHMIPMVDMARLYASRGVLSSVITTPVNASRFRPAVDLAAASGLPIRLVELPFPCQEAGLPDGCENLDTLPSKELIPNFFHATAMLQPAVDRYLSALEPPASCIVSDMGLPWTSKTARQLGVPRLIFHGTCCFTLLCMLKVRRSALSPDISEHEPFAVPGIPHRIEITRAQLPSNVAMKSSMQSLRDEILDSEAAAFGVVVNSFRDLEHRYDERYCEALGKKVRTIGPMSLCNREKAERGNKASIDESQCLGWLDEMTPGSVLYVSFGSMARFSAQQLVEIGLGLEASNHPFIWVIRAGDQTAVVEEWLSEGFEERTRGRSLIIRGWAPQLLILSHPAAGGFLTHCGWNSTLEGISAGLPTITWPLFADQFLNEKLVLEVLQVGVGLGVKSPSVWQEEEKYGLLVSKEEVQRAVERLMDPGEEGEERRKRARELGEKARRAMEEDGSSYANTTLLIEEIISYAK